MKNYPFRFLCQKRIKITACFTVALLFCTAVPTRAADKNPANPEEEMSQDNSYEFIVESHYGTVRRSETKVLGRAKAKDAESAVNIFVKGGERSRLVQDAGNKFFYKAYSSASAVSDLVDSITARPAFAYSEEVATEKAIIQFNEMLAGEANKYKPYHAQLKEGVWYVDGSLPKAGERKRPKIQIRQSDGEVLKISFE